MYVHWWYNTVGLPDVETGEFSTMSNRPTVARKGSRLSIRVTKSEKSFIEQAAEARHANTSQFVLQASLDAARAVLLDQTRFELPPAQWETFCRRLDAPATANPSLRALFAEPDPYGG